MNSIIFLTIVFVAVMAAAVDNPVNQVLASSAEHFVCYRMTSQTAKKSFIEGEIRYLRGLDGHPEVPADDKMHRVSCKHDSGIWIKNSAPNEGRQILNSWDEIADRAQHISQNCRHERDDGTTMKFTGGEYRKDSDKYTVIVGSTRMIPEYC